jgi:hypothetical protein
MVKSRHGASLNRRTALKAAGAAAGAAALGGLPAVAHAARDLKPTDPLYHWDAYEQIANRPTTVRALFEWPNINNPLLWGNLQNLLNGFQFSYDVPADQIQVIVQAYATANAALYDDYIWAKYTWGEFLRINDPTTTQPATRNVFFPSKNPVPAAPPVERDNPFFTDTSIEGLQRRGVLFNI